MIVGARSSLVDIIQMVGRLFRDAEGKAHVEVIQLLPFSLDQVNEAEFRDNLNNYLKAIYASLILENILHPVKINLPKPSEKQEREYHEPIDWLGQYPPDDAKQLSFIEDVSNALMEIVDTSKKTGDVTILWDEYMKVLPSILQDYGITEDVENIGKQLWATFARRSLRMQGLAVDDIPFDILQKTHPLDFILRYTSGSCNIDTFRNLRTAIRAKTFIPYHELKSKIHEMREKGQPINNSREYQVWVQNGCDYEAVIRHRRAM